MHLLTFVGTADGLLAPQGTGPILSAVRALTPESVTLIVTEGAGVEHDYVAVSTSVKKAIAAINPEIHVSRRFLELHDPTDHNEIYYPLRDLTQSLARKHPQITAAISSGTPSMQVCWILLAESGEAPLRLVRTVEPRFGEPLVRPVQLGVGLPRVQALEALELAHAELQRLAIPTVTVDVPRGLVLLDEDIVHLSPRMFTYYRYFLERAKRRKRGPDYLEVRGVFVGGDFATKIVEYHNASFPEKEDLEIARLQKGDYDIQATAFRSTITKLNDRIRQHISDERLHRYFLIEVAGPKSSRQYHVALTPDQITIRLT